MNLLQIVGGQWAIEPAKLIEINGIYSAHVRGEKIDIDAIETKLGRALQNKSTSEYFVIDGVAIIPVDGVIAKRMNMMTQISAGTSSQMVLQALQSAINDPTAHSIILAVDSPGGTVDGTQALADAVYTARQSGKPIVTLASGSMCSAAYWVGSAAQAAYIADGTTLVGSIGVVTSHTDISGAQASQGIKTTELSAGKYKRIASQYAPLTTDGKQSIQESLDYTYGLFVDAVAKNRGVSPAVVQRDMADGRVFIGKQAFDAGLVDGIITQEDLIKKLNSDRKSGVSTTMQPVAANDAAKARFSESCAQSESAEKTTALTAEVKRYMEDKQEPNFLIALKAVTGRV